MAQQADDFQFIQSIAEGIVGFAVAAFFAEQTEHGFHTVAPFQPAGGETIRIGRDFGIGLPVGGQPHNVMPFVISQFRQVIPVKACVVGEDSSYSVAEKPIF